jgi:F1F0 ATPase subunit 2
MVTRTAYPALLTLGSFLVRAALVLAGFHLVMDGSAWRLAAALGGFVIGRMVLVRLLGPRRTLRKTTG